MTTADRSAMAGPMANSIYEVGHLIHDVSRLRVSYFDQAFEGYGVSSSEWWVLGGLHVHGPNGIPQGELGNMLGIKKALMGKIVDQLESAGYVYRVVSKKDRRIRVLKRTAKGKRLSKKLTAHIEKMIPVFHENLDQADIEMAIRTLSLIRENTLEILNR